ncbi:SH3 domain-containing protein [Mesorhizobium caraganae]|uniref:SH3 domain-containing protein n=1 Tax=Mesorhizobium caraganae TaxID=483206 RepID=UPI002897ABAB|nr:SH3 domain-containing protein [Mesorhizobium caraganae]
MTNFYLSTAAALAVASTVLAFTGQSHATAFAAWQVAGVPFGDTLNIRKYPSNASQKQAAYPNGTILQMTGKCTGGLNLLEIAGKPDWKQKQAIRYQWCQVWHDPAQNGGFVTGWGLRKIPRSLLNPVLSRSSFGGFRKHLATSDFVRIQKFSYSSLQSIG